MNSLKKRIKVFYRGVKRSSRYPVGLKQGKVTGQEHRRSLAGVKELLVIALTELSAEGWIEKEGGTSQEEEREDSSWVLELCHLGGPTFDFTKIPSKS